MITAISNYVHVLPDQSTFWKRVRFEDVTAVRVVSLFFWVLPLQPSR
jgi:hypothetical protein